jgi:trk system potassium uptake protein TrkH
VLYLRMVRGSPKAILADSQVRWLVAILAVTILLTTGWLWLQDIMGPVSSLRYAAFNVISIMTGTGYATAAFDNWGGFVMALMFVLMFVGGCAGSTTCGIKIFRFQVLHATAVAQFKRLLQPHGVFFAYYNKKPIPENVAASVMGFFFLFVICYALLAAGLGLFGLDFVTAMSGAASAIANVGPGLGEIIGPSGNFKSLPEGAKWLLAAGMLLGRLELFTVLVLITPAFWRG